MQDFEFDRLSQSEIATLMEVDRTTIRSWTQLGMPHRPPDVKGGRGAYSFSACLYWRVGHELIQRRPLRNKEITPLQKVALGWVMGNETTTFRDDDIAAFSSMMAGLGIERASALRDLDFARGVVDATC